VGIIGDKVGSGKSYVVLALASDSQERTGLTQRTQMRTYGLNRVLISYKEPFYNTVPINLLVIPHNLVSQWETYIRSFSDSLRFLVLARQKTVASFTPDKVHGLDLLVVTNTFYNHVANLLNSRSYKVHRVFFDEVDNMNLPNCVQVEALFYWFVTASYANLLYPRGHSRWDNTLGQHVYHAMGLRNSGFVRNLFMDMYANATRGFVEILVIRNTEEFVQSSITLPDIDARYVVCKTPTSVGILSGLVDPHIIECINAGDIAGAIQLVNPQNRKSETGIVAVLVEKLERQLRYIDARCVALCAVGSTDSDDAEAEHHQAEISRLRRKAEDLGNKIQNIRERVFCNNSCSICFDDVERKTVVPCCSNSFCFRCINKWIALKPNCPICKHDIAQGNLLVQCDDAPTGSPDEQPTSSNAHAQAGRSLDKMQNLEQILRARADGDKFLVFASFDTSLNQINEVMTRVGVNFASLKGNTYQVRAIIQAYKQGHTDALLINARNYGSGLNLENTTDIIMFHKFDTEVENQVIGRAQRFGRTQPLRVWYLLHDNEHQQLMRRARL
jgi:SNF2 family DNA or RNA helicase